MKFKSIRGTKDILPGEVETWQYIEETVRAVMHDYNYREIRTPVFEETALFARSIGELTDIVSKEMYTFTDRSNESLTLKPEGTASVLRAYIQHNLAELAPLTKVYYIAPMFRQERPQAGRLRQFHQFGAEAIGSQSAELDAEMMLLNFEVYRRLGLKPAELVVNSVGCQRCRPPYKELLTQSLLKVYDRLSPESQGRVRQNPLRVLDSKDETDRNVTRNAPLMKDHLCDECSAHFGHVRRLLDKAKIGYAVNGRLVRGLDYYTKTAFEITSKALGSQDALSGGGRYDLLVEELGGKPTPGVGFAAGIERLIIALRKDGPAPGSELRLQLFLATPDETTRTWAFLKATELRSRGFAVEIDYLGRSLKAQMREANRQRARFVAVVGEHELATGNVKVKRMDTGHEIEIAIDRIEEVLRTA